VRAGFGTRPPQVTKERTEIVCLTQVLQDDVNLGYLWENIGLEVGVVRCASLWADRGSSAMLEARPLVEGFA
jgi:hypothetical protein